MLEKRISGLTVEILLHRRETNLLTEKTNTNYEVDRLLHERGHNE